MIIIEQSHEILHMDDIKRIEIAGRTCYKSEDKITGNSANKFCKMLIKRGHEAMLEHASASVKFITNRGITQELVRHRVASFGQESTRYVNYGGDDIVFIRPVWMNNEDKGLYAFTVACERAENGYKELIFCGWRPEQAREVLPNSLKTEIVVTANFREWRHIFKLRAIGTTGKPHPQMQALMMPVLEGFANKCPAIFGDLF
jgi:thymidylate synthase (FAD)